MGRFTQVPSLLRSLDRQIQGLINSFPKDPRIQGVLLIGSCVEGHATYRSDVDLLIILKEGPLTYNQVRKMRDFIQLDFENKGCSHLLLDPLPVQMTLVLDTVFSTEEPAMREALKKALIISDPHGVLKRRALQAIAELDDVLAVLPRDKGKTLSTVIGRR